MAKSQVQVINKALDIIEQIATSNTGLTLSELAKRTELPKSTIHRILSSFTDRHYIEKSDETNIYTLGLKFVEVSSIYLNKIELKTEAAPIMHALASEFNATSYLGVLDNNEVLYLEKVEKLNSLRLYTNIGKREPLYCTALGKILMATLPQDTCSQIGESLKFERYTANTKMSFAELKPDLEFARENGFALDNCENTSGISCIAVAIYDYTGNVIAAMSVSGPGLFQLNKLDTLYEKLYAGALTISQRMGYTFPKKP